MYNVLIIGGGINGAAILYVLSNFSNVDKLALIEKCENLAEINSGKDNNSQTLHVGDIESHYTFEKAKAVSKKTLPLGRYVEKYPKEKLFSKSARMVLAVGREQITALEKRNKEFKKLFPKLRVVYRDEIAKLEPKVVQGRDPNEEIAATLSPDGFIMDYGRITKSFVKHSQETRRKIDVLKGEKVTKVEYVDGVYKVYVGKKVLETKVLVVSAGAHSLSFAYELGYGKDWVLLPVAGRFYYSKKMVNGKVYRWQPKSIPFSVAHADRDVHDANETRYGPMTKVLPMLEWGRWSSVWGFLKLFEFRWSAIVAILKVLANRRYLLYILKQLAYDIPLLGKYIYLKGEVRPIFPTMKYRDLKGDKRIGGIRPQILDIKERRLNLGSAKIEGENVIFNITPSPGASVSLGNAESDVKKIVTFLGKGFSFDQKRFNAEFR